MKRKELIIGFLIGWLLCGLCVYIIGIDNMFPKEIKSYYK